MLTKRTLITEGKLETREDNGQPIIEGYFAVFGGIYDMGGGVKERIGNGAFHLERDTDVRALVNHDTTLVLGRTIAGTLELAVDAKGLRGIIHVNPDDPDAMAAYQRVKRGDVSQCSFGFNILSRDFDYSGTDTIITLTDVELWEVSVCTFPAYSETEITARSKDRDAVLDMRAAEAAKKADEWREAMHSKLKGETNA